MSILLLILAILFGSTTEATAPVCDDSAGIECCHDKIDNDRDGLIDHRDPDCQRQP